MKTVAIVVAAGRGSRAASDQGVKQYVEIGGISVLVRAMCPFLAHAAISRVLVVIHADDRALYDQVVAGLDSEKLMPPIVGGATRQQSVRAGLQAIASFQPDAVLIHDAARPFVSDDDIDGVCAALEKQDGAVVGLPVVDTLKRSTGAPARIGATVARTALWRAQTPQGFRFAGILAAHEAAAADGRDDYTDDASIAEAAGVSPGTVYRLLRIHGGEPNRKPHRRSR